MNVKNAFVVERELDCPKRKNNRGIGNWKTKRHGPVGYELYVSGHEGK